MNIEEQIRRYIYKQVDRLRVKGDSVELQCVYPDIIEYVLVDSETPYFKIYGALYSYEVEIND